MLTISSDPSGSQPNPDGWPGTSTTRLSTRIHRRCRHRDGRSPKTTAARLATVGLHRNVNRTAVPVFPCFEYEFVTSGPQGNRRKSACSRALFAPSVYCGTSPDCGDSNTPGQSHPYATVHRPWKGDRRVSRSNRGMIRFGPSRSDPHDVVFFRRHPADDLQESEPGRLALNSWPSLVRAKARAVRLIHPVGVLRNFAGLRGLEDTGTVTPLCHRS